MVGNRIKLRGPTVCGFVAEVAESLLNSTEIENI